MTCVKCSCDIVHTDAKVAMASFKFQDARVCRRHEEEGEYCGSYNQLNKHTRVDDCRIADSQGESKSWQKDHGCSDRNGKETESQSCQKSYGDSLHYASGEVSD